MSTINTIIYLITFAIAIFFIIAIITIAIIGIKKHIKYLDAKTEYYKNNKN